MKVYLVSACALFATAACLSLAADAAQKASRGVAPAEAQTPPRASELVELSGRLHRPVKWSPQLELVPAGQIARLDLKGKLLEGIKEGTALRVRGVVRTRLHRGGNSENPSPFPPQWIVWLEVDEVEALDHPLDVLKETRRS